MRRRFFLCGLVLACGGFCASAWAAASRRVVSINLCADQLLVALADPEQIAGLSAFAADPEISLVAEQARAFPVTDQRSEAAVALKPDLVLVGSLDRSALRRVLADLGLKVHEVGLVTDFDGGRAQVRDVAALLGRPERGEALVAAIDAAHARLVAATRGRAGTALVVERSGYVAGPESLAGALLRAGGLTPTPGAPQGYGGFVSLERLLVMRPDLLVLHSPIARAEDQGALFLAHPALAALYPPQRRLLLPRRFALCGGAALVAAFDYLAQALSAQSAR